MSYFSKLLSILALGGLIALFVFLLKITIVMGTLYGIFLLIDWLVLV